MEEHMERQFEEYMKQGDNRTSQTYFDWTSSGVRPYSVSFWSTLKYCLKREFSFPTFSRPFKIWKKKREEKRKKMKRDWDE